MKERMDFIGIVRLGTAEERVALGQSCSGDGGGSEEGGDDGDELHF